jgi:glycosyltransferase involved in cell wall biosynthesis
MRVAINAASAQAGGAITYLRNVLPPLEQAMRSNGGGSLVLWAPPDAMGDARIDSVEPRDPGAATNATGLAGLARRVWFDQWELPRRLREDSVDALFSSANFGTLRSRVRQILLVRNALYFDPITMTRIRSRALRARYLAQRMLTIRSILAAEVVLFPSRAMLDLVASHVGAPGPDWRVAPYGTRHDMFAPSTSPRPSTAGPAVLLNVSLYCDQKNLGTLLGAVEVLHARSPGRHQLRLTAGLRSAQPGPWHPNVLAEREVFEHLERAGIAEDIRPQRYGTLPDLYRAADVFVFPSYTESFGHPLVEAMATGLPIVASDVPVNREMCGDAALYFPTFDPGACADAIARVTDDRALARRLGESGLRRAREFTWERHVGVLWSALRGRS